MNEEYKDLKDVTQVQEITGNEELIVTKAITSTSNGRLSFSKFVAWITKQLEDLNLKKVEDVMTIAELRTKVGVEGQYKNLLGYYEAGDKPPLLYKWISGAGEDDRGSVIVSNGGYWSACFVDSVDVRDFGVKTSVTLEQTELIQKVIDKAKELKLKSYFPNGTYLINGRYNEGGRGLLARSNSEMFFEDFAILKVTPQTSGSYTAISFVDVDNVRINQVNLIGEKNEHLGTTGEWGMGLSFLSSKNVYIDNVFASEFWGDGVYLGRIGDNTTNENINIDYIEVSDCRRQGMSVVTADGLRVRYIKIKGVKGAPPEAGIDFEPNIPSEVLKNIRIGTVDCEESNNYAVIAIFHLLDKTSDKIDIEIDTILSNKCGAFRMSGSDYVDKIRGHIYIKNIETKYAPTHSVEISNIKNSVDVTIDDIKMWECNQSSVASPFGAGIRIFVNSNIPVDLNAEYNNFIIGNITSYSSDGKMTKILDVYDHNRNITDNALIKLNLNGVIKGYGIGLNYNTSRIKSRGIINYNGIQNNILEGQELALNHSTNTLIDNIDFTKNNWFKIRSMPIGWELKIKVSSAFYVGISKDYNFKLYGQTDIGVLQSNVVGSEIIIKHIGNNIWGIKSKVGEWKYEGIILP